MTQTTLVIDQPTEYVDRTLQTASWWDRYTLHPGEYPVEWVTIDYRPVREGEKPYYGLVRIDATLEETYRVNTLFTASSSETTQPGTPDTVVQTAYAYSFTPNPKYPSLRPPFSHAGRLVTAD